MELVNFPEKRAKVSVVQLYLDGEPHLVCGTESQFHYQILYDFLKSREIAFCTIEVGKYRSKIPAMSGDRYKVTGMGTIEVAPDIEFFQLPYGKSHDYGIGPDRDFDTDLKKLFPKWVF